MNLQQLKAKYGTTATATVTAPAASASVTPETTVATTYAQAPGLFSRAVKSTVSITTAVAKTTRGVMPVTTRRFENIVEGLNDKHENTDRELFKNKVMIHMIASAAGVNLPTEKELDALYEEYDEYADDSEEAMEVAQEIGEMPEESEVVKEEVVVQEEVIVEEEVAATEQEETKAPTTGRRRLGRQKPIAE